MGTMVEPTYSGPINVEAITYAVTQIFAHVRAITNTENPKICEARVQALVYLMDVEHARVAGETLTGLTWYNVPSESKSECDCDGCTIAKEYDHKYIICDGVAGNPRRVRGPGTNPD